MSHPIKHFKTVTKHRYEVFKLCVKAGIPIQGFTHDLSKYSPTEFIPGAAYWVGYQSPQVTERKKFGYSAAWMHHKGRNKHHFEYWTDYVEGQGTSPIEMPSKYVAEMFCDRVAACKVYKGENYTDAAAWEYLQRARKNYFIHPNTLALLEKLMTMLKDKGEKETLIWIRHNLVYKNKQNIE